MCWEGECVSPRDARLYLRAPGQRGVPVPVPRGPGKGQVEPPAAAHLANLSCVLCILLSACRSWLTDIPAQDANLPSWGIEPFLFFKRFY